MLKVSCRGYEGLLLRVEQYNYSALNNELIYCTYEVELRLSGGERVIMVDVRADEISVNCNYD